MESLEEMLDDSLRVSSDRLDISVIHPRYLDYKARPSQESRQDERRKMLLEQQKKDRIESMNLRRSGLPASERERRKLDKELKKGEQRGGKNQDSDGKWIEEYKGALMMSEWMVEVPSDLETNWIVKACPRGKRVLVIAHKGWTKAYGRNGYEVVKFASSLPGGSYRGGVTGGSLTCLDCVLCQVRSVSTLYVLDVIHWGADLTDCDAEFRFFWLSSKMAELAAEDEPGSSGGQSERMGDGAETRRQYRFEAARTLTPTELGNLPHPLYEDNSPRLDGILFYERHAWYTWRGPKTPLVLWLKPFMLQDVLGLPVHPAYLDEKPPQYSSLKMEVSETTTGEVKNNKPGGSGSTLAPDSGADTI